jgi:molybdenum cofactor cytidylyltransferase
MAAGSSQRFGENKLAAVVGGKTLLERALEAVPTDLVSAVCVVTQYHQAEALARRFGFSCVRNEHPEQGISSTIRLGTQRLQRECQALMYLVCDQPLLRRESVAALVEFSQAHPDHIIGAAHGGVRGNPCIFPRRFYPELCALTGDVGGSAVIRRHSQALLLYELDGRELADVDTPQALAALEE